MRTDNLYKQLSSATTLCLLFFSSSMQADELSSSLAIDSNAYNLPLVQISYYVIAGFYIGIIAYNCVLFWCTRENIYLHFSAVLLVFSCGFMVEKNTVWHYHDWPHTGLVALADTVNLIVFIGFLKHILNLFVDFKRLHPIITLIIDTYRILGLFLILSYLVFPQSLLIKALFILVIIASLTVPLTAYYWYPTLKHLPPFIITGTLFALMMVYRSTDLLYAEINQLNWQLNIEFISESLMFLSFSTLITNRLNIDREQRALAQQVAIQQLQKYQDLYENALEGLFTTFMDGRLLAANPELKRMLNLPAHPQGHINLTYLHSYFTEQDAVWNSLTHQLMLQGTVEAIEIQGRENTWYSLSARCSNTDAPPLIEGSLIDISQRKRQEQQLEFLAKHDPLTQLHNRTEFENYLQDAIYSEGLHTLLFIDLDQFKVINDTCGHAAGDECLQQIADLLKQHMQPIDMLARLGGDEFGFILWNQPLAVGKIRAEQLRQDLENHHFQWMQRVFKTTISIGLIALDQRISCAEQALSLADAACYEAKHLGRNHVIVNDPDKHITIYRHSQMEMVATLTQALRDDQLYLFQQPIIALAAESDSLAHFEVLVRLQTENGLLNPGAFLPAAQRYNLLPHIDKWVFNNICAWLSHPRPLSELVRINMNISQQTLCDANFIAYVRSCLDDYGIASTKICFEITEQQVLNKFTLMVRQIGKLRDLGFSFALDNFGSGFASFELIKRLAINTIKIDGQLVRGINSNSADRIMVQAITDITHKLGKQVIAEWVENAETEETLRQLGVDFVQGNYFGKPEIFLATQDYKKLPALYQTFAKETG